MEVEPDITVCFKAKYVQKVQWNWTQKEIGVITNDWFAHKVLSVGNSLFKSPEVKSHVKTQAKINVKSQEKTCKWVK